MENKQMYAAPQIQDLDMGITVVHGDSVEQVNPENLEEGE